MSRGGRNLIILGIASALIALVTTGISLAIYHKSGDIYLDRSRPGFLPDEDEKDDDNPIEEYVFEKTGAFTEDVIKEYTEKFNDTMENIKELNNPFSETGLSDKELGI